MRQRVAAVAGLALVGSLGLVGCGKTTAAPVAGAPTASQPATASPRASATPSPAASPRSTAELKRALLTLDDVPSGLSLSKDDGAGGPSEVRSTKAACAALVRLLKADRTPGSVSYADTGFDGGASGPFFGETLESFPAGGARSAVDQVRQAVRGCDEVQMDLDGTGAVPFAVAEASAPKLGDAATAVRFTAADSSTGAEFQLDVSFVAAGDVLLSSTGAAADPADLEGFTTDAYNKLVSGSKPSSNRSQRPA